ncbi:hypothetical protein ADUPG1_006954, partial [Aduncisulcus paluster]
MNDGTVIPHTSKIATNISQQHLDSVICNDKFTQFVNGISISQPPLPPLFFSEPECERNVVSIADCQCVCVCEVTEVPSVSGNDTEESEGLEEVKTIVDQQQQSSSSSTSGSKTKSEEYSLRVLLFGQHTLSLSASGVTLTTSVGECVALCEREGGVFTVVDPAEAPLKRWVIQHMNEVKDKERDLRRMKVLVKQKRVSESAVQKAEKLLDLVKNSVPSLPHQDAREESLLRAAWGDSTIDTHCSMVLFLGSRVNTSGLSVQDSLDNLLSANTAGFTTIEGVDGGAPILDDRADVEGNLRCSVSGCKDIGLTKNRNEWLRIFSRDTVDNIRQFPISFPSFPRFVVINNDQQDVTQVFHGLSSLPLLSEVRRASMVKSNHYFNYDVNNNGIDHLRVSLFHNRTDNPLNSIPPPLIFSHIPTKGHSVKLFSSYLYNDQSDDFSQFKLDENRSHISGQSEKNERLLFENIGRADEEVDNEKLIELKREEMEKAAALEAEKQRLKVASRNRWRVVPQTIPLTTGNPTSRLNKSRFSKSNASKYPPAYAEKLELENAVSTNLSTFHLTLSSPNGFAHSILPLLSPHSILFSASNVDSFPLSVLFYLEQIHKYNKPRSLLAAAYTHLVPPSLSHIITEPQPFPPRPLDVLEAFIHTDSPWTRDARQKRARRYAFISSGWEDRDKGTEWTPIDIYLHLQAPFLFHTKNDSVFISSVDVCPSVTQVDI